MHAAAAFPALACSAALPVLLLNPERVPTLVSFSSTSVRVSDLGLAAAVAVTGVFAVKHGDIHRARPWLWLAPFLVFLFASAALSEGQTEAVSGAGKMVEWAFYGVAVTLAARNPDDLRRLAAAFAGCALVFGSIGVLEVLRNGGRADALVGTNALGLIGAVAVAMALAGWPSGFGVALRRLLAIGGLLCLLSSASLGGILAATVTVLVVAGAAATRMGARARWELAAAGAITLLALVSVLALRFDDISAAQGGAARTSVQEAAAGTLIDGAPAGAPTQAAINGHVGGSVAQRAMYADFGVRMWLEKPVFGVGFQRSSEPAAYLPVLPDVRADFPDLRADYFPPAPGTPFASMETAAFGLHSVYVQVPAELGLAGTVLLIVGIAGLVRSGRSPSPSLGERAMLLPLVAILAGFADHAFYGGVPDATLFVWALGLAAARGDAGIPAPGSA